MPITNHRIRLLRYELADPKQDAYLTVRDLGLEVSEFLGFRPNDLTEAQHSDLGVAITAVLERHRLLRT